MDNKFLGIRKISSSQKTDLINTGSTTVNGTTKTVQNDVIYLAPDIDSELLKMDADGNVTTVKAFVSPRDLTLTIGTKGEGYIDWGDGTVDIISADGSIVHTYSTANIYLVKMYGFNAITSFDNEWYGYMGLVEFVDYIEESENGSFINIEPEYFPLIRVGMKLYFTNEKDVSIPNVTATIIAIGEDNACILDTDVFELVPMGGHAYLSPVPDSTTIAPNPIYEANVSKFLDSATATFLAHSSDGAQCAKKIIVPYEQLENYKTTYADFTGVDTSNIFDSYAFVSEVANNFVSLTGDQNITGQKSFSYISTSGIMSYSMIGAPSGIGFQCGNITDDITSEPFIKIDNCIGGRLDVKTDGAYFNNEKLATEDQLPKLYRHDLTFNTFSVSIYTRDSNAYTDVSEFKDKLPAVLPVAYYDDTYAGGATLLTESVYGSSNEIDARLTGVVTVWAGDGDALLINQELTLANEFWDDTVTEI